jgi:hypothetical protein
MLDYVHRHDPEKPFSVYRLMNLRTGRFYIGSSAQVATRFLQHKAAIQKVNHDNTDIQYDSIWCGLDDWSFRLLSRHANRHEMAQREMAFIRVFAGRNSCYNFSLHYTRDPVPVEWIVFNLKNGRSRQYLNRRGGSLSVIYIYNPSLEETPSFDRFDRLPDLLKRDISVKELLKPRGRLGILPMNRSAIDGQVYEGNVVVTDGPDGEIVSLTPHGRCFALYQIKLQQESDARAAKLAIVATSRMDALVRRDRAATVAMRQAAQLAKHHPGMVNELARLPEGQYFVAVHSANHLNFHKFVVGDDAEENLSKLSGFGEIFGVIERTDQPDPYDDLCVVTRNGAVVISSLPEEDEYKRKRVAWMKMYTTNGDSVVSMFRTLGDIYIAAVTTTGLVIVVINSEIPHVVFQSRFFRLVAIGTAPLVAACSILKGGRLLAVTQKGFALPLIAEGKYIARQRGDRPRKIENYKPNMGPVIWMAPFNRGSCLEQHLAITTSDERLIVLGAISTLVGTDEKPLRLLDLADGEVITAVDLVSSEA